MRYRATGKKRHGLERWKESVDTPGGIRCGTTHETMTGVDPDHFFKPFEEVIVHDRDIQF